MRVLCLCLCDALLCVCIFVFTHHYHNNPLPRTPPPKNTQQVVQTVTKKPLAEVKKFLILEVICMDAESGDDVEVPYVRLRIK